MKKFFLSIVHLRYKKYIVVIVAGVLLVGFLGESSVVAHMRNMRRISHLQAEKTRYENEYKFYQDEIFNLQTNPKAVEQRARELYFMHTPDEDVFVLSDDAPQSTNLRHETVE